MHRLFLLSLCLFFGAIAKEVEIGSLLKSIIASGDFSDPAREGMEKNVETWVTMLNNQYVFSTKDVLDERSFTSAGLPYHLSSLAWNKIYNERNVVKESVRGDGFDLEARQATSCSGNDFKIVSNANKDILTVSESSPNVKVDGSLTVTGCLTASCQSLRKFSVTGLCDSLGTQGIQFTAPDGQTRSLDIAQCATGQYCYDTGSPINAKIAYRKGASATDPAMLFLKLQGTHSLSCTLLHNEDDWPVFDLAFATDGGNCCEGIWGGQFETFLVSRKTQNIVFDSCGSYEIICF